MDAQVSWDRMGTCSCWHGVTSVIMGNCGFALAPCQPEAREWFARCLTAVEDIPTEAMLAGIDWTWETFPEYLAAVERLGEDGSNAIVVGDSVWDLLAARRAKLLGIGLLSGGYGDDELTRAGAYRVYDDPAMLLSHLDEVGIRVD